MRLVIKASLITQECRQSSVPLLCFGPFGISDRMESTRMVSDDNRLILKFQNECLHPTEPIIRVMINQTYRLNITCLPELYVNNNKILRLHLQTKG